MRLVRAVLALLGILGLLAAAAALAAEAASYARGGAPLAKPLGQVWRELHLLSLQLFQVGVERKLGLDWNYQHAGEVTDFPVKPDDIAATVLFLASDDARMCTGQEFTVDAGWS